VLRGNKLLVNLCRKQCVGDQLTCDEFLHQITCLQAFVIHNIVFVLCKSLKE